MKTLYLLRHAKSSWKDASLADFDRPLSGRGKRDALLLGWVMKELAIQPDLIICSSTKRTRVTLKRVCNITKRKKTIISYDDRVYEASSQSLYSLLESLDDSYESVLLIGHNPGLTQLAQVYGVDISEIETAGFLSIDCHTQHITWRYVSPKNLASTL